MPITYSCKNCQQILQVDDGLAGQTVACPKCGHQQIVEAPGAFNFSSPQNPYQSPSNPAPIGTGLEGAVSDEVFPTQFDVGWVFNHAFTLWKQNLGLLLAMSAIAFGISFAHSLVDTLLTALMANVRDQTLEMAFIVGKGSLSLLVAVINFWIQIGQVKLCLGILRRKPVTISEMFTGGDVFWPVLGVSILFGLAMLTGFLLLIIPGILVALYFWPVYYFVLDKKSRVMDSFSNVLPFTKINVANSFVVFLIGVGVNLLGFLACCIGLLFSVPLVVLFTTASYLAMTGQLQQHAEEQPQYSA